MLKVPSKTFLHLDFLKNQFENFENFKKYFEVVSAQGFNVVYSYNGTRGAF